MKQKQYRLLNEGEKIEEGDELWDGLEWVKCLTFPQSTNNYSPRPVFNALFFIRRPLQTDWIKLSERKPTEEDADEMGRVIFRWKEGQISYQQWNDEWALILPKTAFWVGPASHWHPLPKFEEVDQDEEAFLKWYSNSQSCYHEVGRYDMRRAWDAAIAYARNGGKEEV